MLNKMTTMIFIILIGTLFGDEPTGVDGEIICETIETNGTDYKFELKPVSGMTEWCTNVDWLVVPSAGTNVVQTPYDICRHNDYVFKVCKVAAPRFNQTIIELTIYEFDGGWVEIISFKIDYRDCRFRALGYGSEDIAILVDGSDNKVYYSPGIGPIDCEDEEEYTQISNDETLKIWEVNDYSGSRDISCMCPDPVLTSITNYNNRPKVLWRHEDDPNGSYSYEVWRQLTPFLRPRGTWSLIDTVTDTSFVDNEISIGSGTMGRAYYKIRAKIDDLKSEYSSYDYINYGGILKPFVQNSDAIDVLEFKLYTNYPNPFNPTTTISFDLPKESTVSLQIYDIQGRVISILMNETMDAGSHSFWFNSSGLTSGVYFYKLQTQEFTDIKRMLLLK